MPAKRKPDDNLNDNDAPSSKASKTDDSSNLNAAAQATEQPLSFLSFLQKFGLNGLSTLSKNIKVFSLICHILLGYLTYKKQDLLLISQLIIKKLSFS